MRPAWLVSYFAIALKTDERIINTLNSCHVFERCEFAEFLKNIRAKFNANLLWTESISSIPNSSAISIDFYNGEKDLIVSDRLLYVENMEFVWYDEYGRRFEYYIWELGYKIVMWYVGHRPNLNGFGWITETVLPHELEARILTHIK